jgi:hypothetical protein
MAAKSMLPTSSRQSGPAWKRNKACSSSTQRLKPTPASISTRPQAGLFISDFSIAAFENAPIHIRREAVYYQPFVSG